MRGDRRAAAKVKFRELIVPVSFVEFWRRGNDPYHAGQLCAKAAEEGRRRWRAAKLLRESGNAH